MTVKIEIEISDKDAEMLKKYYDDNPEHPFPLKEVIEHVVHLRVGEMLGYKVMDFKK
jgi:hypothetical protein